MRKLQEYPTCGVLILAAGQGKRMRSSLPKVLHEIAGKPILYHVFKRVAEAIPGASIGLVVGHGKEQVEKYVRQETDFKDLKVEFIVQSEQKGTGHAARCAVDSEWGKQWVENKLPILVLPGDFPLLSADLIKEISQPLKKGVGLRLLTCDLEDPSGYGRILRKGKQGPVFDIREEKDASEKEKAIQEVAVSIYLFESSFLRSSLQNLSSNNAQSEYYLTDTIAFSHKKKKKIEVLKWKNTDDLRGVNDPWELSQAGQLMNYRIIRKWASQGVKFVDPTGVRIDSTVKLEEDVVIDSGVLLLENTQVGKGTIIGPRVVLKNMEVGERVQLKVGTVAEESRIYSEAQLGPYAHLRPQSEVGSKSKIGNFVELKKTKIGKNTSVAHLSYLGDAEVGDEVNIGCGFVTCNFDGRVVDGQRKHKTVIEDRVFLGSDCQTVAPVKVGQGSYVASGSTITEDVPADSLAIARSRQVNKLGYAKKIK